MNVSDLTMSAVFFVMGGSFLLIRKQQERARQNRVSGGELTSNEVLKKNWMNNWCICIIFGIALMFLIFSKLRF